MQALSSYNSGLLEHVKNPSETNVKLDECNKEEKREATMFKKMVGSLRYLCKTRPDICFAVIIISRYMIDLRKSHLAATKRILRYVKRTMKPGLLFPTENIEIKVELICYSD